MQKNRFRSVRYFLGRKRWLGAIRHPIEISRLLFRILKRPQLTQLLMVNRNVEGLISFDLGVLLCDIVLKAKSSWLNVAEVGAFKGLSTC